MVYFVILHTITYSEQFVEEQLPPPPSAGGAASSGRSKKVEQPHSERLAFFFSQRRLLKIEFLLNDISSGKRNENLLYHLRISTLPIMPWVPIW